MPVECQRFLVGFSVPDFNRRVTTATGYPLSIRAETHAEDITRVSRERRHFLAGFDIPDRDLTEVPGIPTSTDDPLPVGVRLTLKTGKCPLSVSVSWPVSASHTFTVSSRLPLMIRWPSGLKITHVIGFE